VNYDPAKYPDRWQRYKDFSYRQIEELMTGYGAVDILWLDGGWIRPIGNIPQRFEEWARKGNWNQDIDIGRIAAMARRHQPGLLVVDRTVAGRYENYVTPENSVPDGPIEVPWEACLTMGRDQWSFKPGQPFRSTRELIHTLVDIVSKGGNLLLDIGPGPDGEWPDSAYARLEEIGAWMTVNGAAIHGTRSTRPFNDGNIRFTRDKNTNALFAVYMATPGETAPPAQIRLTSIHPTKGARMTMLGVSGDLHWTSDANGCTIEIPSGSRKKPPCEHAWVVRISAVQ
jgi:alpha-L-fucosidase